MRTAALPGPTSTSFRPSAGRPFVEVAPGGAGVGRSGGEGGFAGERVVGFEEDAREVGGGAGEGDFEVPGAAGGPVGGFALDQGDEGEGFGDRLGVEVGVAGRGGGGEGGAGLVEHGGAEIRVEGLVARARLQQRGGRVGALPAAGGAAGEVGVFDQGALVEAEAGARVGDRTAVGGACRGSSGGRSGRACIPPSCSC